MADSGKTIWQHRIILLLILIPLFALSNVRCNRSKSSAGYDGTWWMNTPSDQRSGFIDGFVDCYAYGCSEESTLCTKRTELQTAISSYYAKHQDDESMPVGEVLLRVAKSKGGLASEGSEFGNLDQQAGPFDGLAWLSYSPKKRMGFVEGFLNALMPQSSRGVAFPKNPEYYSDALTRFYSGPQDSHSQTGTSEYPAKKRIADVLWSMRNQRR